MKSEAPDPNITVYFQGQYVPLGEANVNILTHGLNYGTGVFEGIRGYYNAEQRELFLVRAVEHYERWKGNCGILGIRLAESATELAEITAELCRRNGFTTDVYVRPLAYKASARIGVSVDDNDAFGIVVVPFGDYYGTHSGFKAGVVSWRRVQDNAIPGRGKIAGAYANSVLAGTEARANGHDEAIFLTESGNVAEAAAANIFIVRKGKLITPPITENVLEGITRESVMELARREMGVETVERVINRSELYICDEIFYTGTAVEVLPVTFIDHRPVGGGVAGPITGELRRIYREATRGRMPAYQHWLLPAKARKPELQAAR